MDSLSIGPRGFGAVLFNQPAGVGLVVPAYHAHISANTHLLAGVCIVLALAFWNSGMGDPPGAIPTKIKNSVNQRFALPGISRI